ncbi:MAG: hypothetical protein H6597_06730 [Flavobacteriales bacterium]|nr:hypothetical protein [Flavobacteriales bacterium]
MHASTPTLVLSSITALLLASAPVTSQAQDAAASAKEENPGYFHGGLNLQLSSVRRSLTSTHVHVSRPGFILGLGSEFFFGNYVADRFRFGMNVGWFSLSGNFGDHVSGIELQVLKPGLLFSTKANDNLRIDFKYSLMPSIGTNIYTGVNDNSDANLYWGLPHGPYLGITYRRFMAGLEYLVGTMHVVDDNTTNDYYFDRWSANTFRVLVGVNY